MLNFDPPEAIQGPVQLPKGELMSSTMRVAVLVGSLRKDSISRKVAHALGAVAPDSLKLESVEIGALALYDQDLEGAVPPRAWADCVARTLIGRAFYA